MNKAREHCGIFPQEGMPGGFPLTDLYNPLSITGITCSSNHLSCFPSLTQGGQGMCQKKGKSDISEALSSLPHPKRIYSCNQLHFFMAFSFKVIRENLLRPNFGKRPCDCFPAIPWLQAAFGCVDGLPLQTKCRLRITDPVGWALDQVSPWLCPVRDPITTSGWHVASPGPRPPSVGRGWYSPNSHVCLEGKSH